MPRFILDKALEEATELPTMTGVVFTGGEPTLFMEDLLYGISKAHRLGFGTRVVTNAFWARSDATADEMVSRLKAAGLDEINTSYDDYHAEFMPVENVYRFIKAALKYKLTVAVASIVDNWGTITSKTILEGAAQFMGVPIDEMAHAVVFVEDKPTPAGRGRELAELTGRIATYDKATESFGCKEIGKTLSIHPDGSVHLCCGHASFDTKGLSVGNISDTSLKTMVDVSRSNLLYWWIHMRGTNNILKQVGDPVKYASVCDACLHIFTDRKKQVLEYIREHRSEILLNDVLLSEDYMTIFSQIEEKLRTPATPSTS